MVYTTSTKKRNSFVATFLLAYSVLTKFLFCIYSIRFDKVYIDTDGAIFYSIGKSLKNGYVLYKDIFDHKTPYIYFINMIASCLDENHIGLFIIEIIVLFVTLYFIYKFLMIVFKSNWLISLLGCILMSFVFTIPEITFLYSRTEAFAVMFIMPAFYIFANYFVKESGEDLNEATTAKAEFSTSNMFLIGVLAGLTFMTNIRAVILYVPFAIALFIKNLRAKRYASNFKLFVAGILGVFASIIPYIIYMILTNSYIEAYNAIIETNLLYGASNVASNLGKLETGIVFISENIAFYIFVLISFILVLIWKSDFYLKWSVSTSLIVAFIYVTFSNRTHIYYLVILMPYFLSIYIAIVNLFSKLVVKGDKKSNYSINKSSNIGSNSKFSGVLETLIIIIAIVVAIINYGINSESIDNRYKNAINRSSRISQIITENVGEIKDLNILSFGFNPEVYVYLDTLPKYKYFIIPNVSYKRDNTPYNEQISYLKNENTDVVVYREGDVNNEFPRELRNIINLELNDNYTLLGKVRTNEIEGEYYIFARNKR